MAIRKCTSSEAYQAAKKYGCRDEHEFKTHVVGSSNQISRLDIFIDTATGAIYVADKDGSNRQYAGIKL